jgi:hypothetical protein
MRRFWFITVLAGCGLALLIALLVLTSNREPRYNGRTLSQWLVIEREALFTYDTTRNASPGNADAENAVRHIGTNALPQLIKWLDYENHWTTRFRHQILSIKHALHLKALVPVPDRAGKQQLAVGGFLILGSNATPAISQLQHLARQSKPPAYDNRRLAIFCLANIGSAARPTLAEFMKDPDPGISAAAKAAYLHTLEAVPDGVFPSR